MPATDLPSFTRDDLSDEKRVAAFARSFLERDPRASQLLNPSNTLLFEHGYRPVIGLPNDPEGDGDAFVNLEEYFIRKVYLDLDSLEPVTRASLEVFLDQLGEWSYHTLTGSGRIIERYQLDIQGRFHFPTELAKIPPGEEQEEFVVCWLNDAVLATESRMLAWIFLKLFGTPYIIPEKRSRADR